MSRPARSQRQRNQNFPVDLGLFTQTSLRLMQGRLGPLNELIGFSDTNQLSNGGYGGGTYNHWFKVKLASPAWIILQKGPPTPTYLQVSCYDLNKVPIESRMIFDADSIVLPDPNSPNGKYYPYFDHVMGAGSDLYNFFDPNRLDKGNSLYFPLTKGQYLICISSTRNELIDYQVGMVIEFPDRPPYLMRCEDLEEVLVALEDDIDLANTETIFSPITSDLTIGPSTNAFTDQEAEIIPSGTTVTVEATGVFENRATWWIGTIPSGEDAIELNVNDGYESTFHSHSLTEWIAAWQRDHQESAKFPDLFIPLTNEP